MLELAGRLRLPLQVGHGQHGRDTIAIRFAPEIGDAVSQRCRAAGVARCKHALISTVVISSAISNLWHPIVLHVRRCSNSASHYAIAFELRTRMREGGSASSPTLRTIQCLGEFGSVIPTLRLCRHRQTHRKASVFGAIQIPDGVDERLDIMTGTPARRERAQLVLDLSVG